MDLNHMTLSFMLRSRALKLYTSVITSSTTNIITTSSLISQRIGIVRQGCLAGVCWAANRRAVLLRTGDACDLEDSVDNTTNTLAGDETGGNGVACENC
jgi:hypothetical protein